jgi:hypothetical protein
MCAATLIVFRHRSNLVRVRAGTEPRVGSRLSRLEADAESRDA